MPRRLEALAWIGFVLLVLLLLAFDLGVAHRQGRVVRFGEALAWTAFYVVLALSFDLAVFFLYEHHLLGLGVELGHDLRGREAALQFLVGWLLEKSLSLDNIFVIALILAWFRVPPPQQHRVLFWGVLGALVLRGVMIAAGAVLLQRFDWMTYVFGGLLLVSALRMLLARPDAIDPGRNPLVRLARRVLPVTADFHGARFLVRIDGRRAITPLLLALLVVETADVAFAVDSIPAIFAVTSDPFLVFTSNVFAILGLRSLYFALAGLMDRFRHLKTSLVLVLAYVGVKMLVARHHPIPNLVSLCVVTGLLGLGVAASVALSGHGPAGVTPPLLGEAQQLASLTFRQARRVLVLLLGSTIALIGVVMLATPGPGMLVIPLGLAVLGLEFAWARRWLARLRSTARSLEGRVRRRAGKDRRRA